MSKSIRPIFGTANYGIRGNPSRYVLDFLRRNGFDINSNSTNYETTPIYANTEGISNNMFNFENLQTTPSPWQNNQTLTPWAGGYDLSAQTQSNNNYISDEDLYARMWENIK